jgi:DNA-directed RNA polymerase specialized sigma subunit
MKIKFQDANGRIHELEVSAEIWDFYIASIEAEEGNHELEVSTELGDFCIASFKGEKSNDRANTRRHISLSTLKYEDRRFFDSGVDIEGEYAEADAVQYTLRQMTDRERFLILAHYDEGRSYTEIGKAEGKYPSTIMRETDKAAEKFKKIYKKI